jgi:uncharacterized protein (DUF1697 family)
MVYVALLRGVNVGGNNKLPMKSLTALCEAQGCTKVQTFIQSGNVVFRASAKIATALPSKLTSQIKDEFGFETTVILRTAAELRSIVAGKPDLDEQFLHVIFLADEPNLTDVVKLNPVCAGAESFILRGREIYIYLPNGAGRSKMATYAFDKVLRTRGSMRNWRTVLSLSALAIE